MKIVLKLNFSEELLDSFREATKLYPYELSDKKLIMTANLVQCMELVSIVSLYNLSEEKPVWGGDNLEKDNSS